MVSGDDQRTYLQGQLSNDLAGHASRALVLTPTSEVLSDVAVFYGDAETRLVLRTECVEAVVTRLRRFVLRSKVIIATVDDVEGPYATLSEQVLRCQPGPAEFARGLTPHAFGGPFVRDTVSFTKGCYTGQELVGRLDARGGNTPFRLVALAAASVSDAQSFAAEGPEGGPQGLTTAVVESGGVRGLAIVHRRALATVGSSVQILSNAINEDD